MAPATDHVDVYLRSIGDSIGVAVGATLQGFRESLGALHQLDIDLRVWDKFASSEAKAQLQVARRELALAEYCAAGGLYRQSYASLRLFLELSFAAVYFSVNEFERRRWYADKMDFSWSRALDRDEGVLSRSFVEMFAPTLTSRSGAYASKVSTVYRGCSQFIHGKVVATATLPETPEFSADVFTDWATKAHDAAESVLFLLMVRFADQLAGPVNPDLTDMLAHRFGHLTEVRELIGMTNA